MKDLTNGELVEQLQYAEEIKEDSLKQCLYHLENSEGTEWCNTVEIYNDFAPRSFYFVRLNREGLFAGNGGIIFHGNHDKGGTGAFPTFSVSLNPDLRNHWSIHT